MKFQRIGPTGLLRVGTMMTNWWHDQWPESCDGQWGVSQTWWDDGSGWYCDGYGYTWQQGPVQSAEPSASHDNKSDVQKTGSVGSMIINPFVV